MHSRLIACVLLLFTVLGCTHKKTSSRAPEEFLWAPNAENAAALPWQSWSPAAFDEARAKGKPVFLSITQRLCTWCSVLDKAILSNDRVGGLLKSKFVLIRVNAELYPEVADRFASEGLPRIAILNNKGDQLWTGGVLQPTQLNQTLNAALRNELAVTLPANVRRFEPNPYNLRMQNNLNVSYPYQFLSSWRLNFDNEFKGYYPGKSKSLALAALDFDLFLGVVEWSAPDARRRIDRHLDSVFAKLYDNVDGGFLTGSQDAAWNDIIPIKRSGEQAKMAGLLSAMAYWRGHGVFFEHSVTDAAERADGAVAVLLQRFVDGGEVRTGEIGTREYYKAERRGSLDGTQTSPVLQTSVTGETIEGLATAGFWAGKQEWIDKAAAMADAELARRRPNGLFWHVKDVSGDRLADQTAMLGAELALYTATSEEKWLAEAGRLATAMEALYDAKKNYYLDVTAVTARGLLPGEPMPALNVATASRLLKLAVLTNDINWLRRAAAVAAQYATAPDDLLGEDEPAYVRLMWQITHDVFRIDLPRAWRSLPAAAGLMHPANTRVWIHWVEASSAQACNWELCSPKVTDPAKLTAVLQPVLANVAPPKAENRKNPFFH